LLVAVDQLQILTGRSQDFPCEFPVASLLYLHNQQNKRGFKVTTRVLVVDDFKPWRSSVRLILESNPSLRVIGEASNGQEAIEKATEMQPDLILLDVGMPSLNGIDAAKIIHQRCPESKILFVSLDDGHVRNAAGQVGAKGYVLKANAGKELLAAISTALNHN